MSQKKSIITSKKEIDKESNKMFNKEPNYETIKISNKDSIKNEQSVQYLI